MNPPLRALTLTAALAASFGIAAAQVPVPVIPDFYSDASHLGLLWNSQWGTAAFGKTCSGEFTGDGMRDVFTLSGTQVVMSWNLVVHSFQQALATPANDFATYPGGGAGRDALAVVNTNGLSKITYSTSAQTFSTTSLGGGNWANAKRVACGDIDDNGVIDFAGVHSDQQRVVWRFGEAGSDYLIDTQLVVRDVALLPWSTSTSNAALAVLTTNGVCIYSLASNGTAALLYSHQRPAETSTIAMTIVPAASETSRDWLAVLYATSGASPSKEVLIYADEANDNLWPPLQLLSTLNYCAIASGDGDGDGDHDLLVSCKRAAGPLYCPNSGGATPFSPSYATWLADKTYPASPSSNDPLRNWEGPLNSATPVFADFNEDGRADLVLALADTPGSGTVPAHIHLENRDPSTTTQLVSTQVLQGGSLYTKVIGGNTHLVGYLTVRTTIPAFAAGNANAVRVTVHRQANAEDTGPFDLAVAEVVVAIDGALYAPELPTSIAIPIETPWVVDAEWDDACDPGSLREVFWVEMQPVKTDSTTPDTPYDIVQAWTTRLGAIVTDNEDLCTYEGEEYYGGQMHTDGESYTWPGGGWTGVPGGCALNPGSCINHELSGGTTLKMPAIFTRRRLPPTSLGSLPEYPSDTYMSGTLAVMPGMIPPN